MPERDKIHVAFAASHFAFAAAKQAADAYIEGIDGLPACPNQSQQRHTV
ncbi:hypothetical protein [Tianweitania sediminis]|uniref:Uncharacterized protein n=1 Tax=Tianweitania sediminis TaxID=1502156 RepID=A0A8J7R455_9HYPH|nr:hypothetical protein [Tianweitania sediminis]MBP0440758.1 hypothetical protein [Tianweitania sediminis]HEV7417446.1 hypothetical protein [Tianweitania sediminis]